VRNIKKYLQQQKNLIYLFFGSRPAGQLVDTRDSDVWLVSYPKSGNTWVRFLLGNLMIDEPVDFLSVEDVIPDIHVNSLWQLARAASPRVLKSHYPYDWRYRKVIYIVRDPRDVLVSYWMHQKKTKKIPLNYSIESFGMDFIKGDLPYGSWFEHVGSWLGAREKSKDFTLVKYEDLLENTPEILKSIVDGIDEFPAARMDFNEAVALSNFNKMKELEMQQQVHWRPIKKSLHTIRFVREGKSGQWRESLSDSLSNSIWHQWGGLMAQLGYYE